MWIGESVIKSNSSLFSGVKFIGLILTCSKLSKVLKSAVSVQILAPSLISLLEPLAPLYNIEPGTTITFFPCSNASLAVINEPLFSEASTTITPSLSPLIILFLLGKFCFNGPVPIKNSEIPTPIFGWISYIYSTS